MYTDKLPAYIIYKRFEYLVYHSYQECNYSNLHDHSDPGGDGVSYQRNDQVRKTDYKDY